MSALPADLQTKGLLDQTLVVLGTEFGRTPRINDNDGRDHDKELRCLLTGAGTKEGEADVTSTAATSRGHQGKLLSSVLATPCATQSDGTSCPLLSVKDVRYHFPHCQAVVIQFIQKLSHPSLE